MIVPYAGIIIKICRAYTDTEEDFQDYYQEVCLQIWRSRQRFREDAQWSTFVYRIALNVCLTFLRKKTPTRRAHSIDDSLFGFVINDAFQDEKVKVLYEAIKKLKEVDRALILLYLEGHKYDEIADISGTNSNNVGVKILRIKKQLKRIIENEYY
jgi:RNA polymerase sigma-70 factor (ECF subfamily)